MKLYTYFIPLPQIKYKMITGSNSKYVSINGGIVANKSILIPRATTVLYDVIRIDKGIPLFVELHIARLFDSFALADISISFSKGECLQWIAEFIQHERISIGNIRCAYYAAEVPFFAIFGIPHSYPPQEAYKRGIELGVLKAERESPNIKQELQVRTKANEIIQKKSVHDVLLIDSKNNITECSRANVFFIKNNIVYTAPASDVLVGITRKKLCDIMFCNSINYSEERIALQDIGSFESAFITGTSPKILPIAIVHNYATFNTKNSLLQLLIELYNDEISRYILHNSQTTER